MLTSSVIVVGEKLLKLPRCILSYKIEKKPLAWVLRGKYICSVESFAALLHALSAMALSCLLGLPSFA